MHIKVSIVDDDKDLRASLATLIRGTESLRLVGSYPNAKTALEEIPRNPPDVVLMDINMPGGSAGDALQRIRSRRPAPQVLILSMLPEEQVALGFMRMGAAGYVSKDAAADELVTAIRTALAGKRYVSAALARRLAGGEAAPHELLSPRELEVLRFIATGLAVKEIADRLSLSASTVHTHRARILLKLHLRSDVELSRYATRHRLVD